MTPRRIQRRRTKGWVMPENTVYVGRPTMWGNYASDQAGVKRGRLATILFRDWIENEASETWKGRMRIDLRGRNLACWCRLCNRHQDGKPLGEDCPACQPCHADVLLQMANKEDAEQ